MQTESMASREKLFTMRLSDEERERAERVAVHYGLNVAGVLRMLLKREDLAIPPAPPVTKAKKSKR